jgi:phage repressor protein C with HTH and peptisase S24 domain
MAIQTTRHDPRSVGDKIASARAQRGWSQSELASQSGVSQQLINKLEAGLVQRSKFIPEIARALGVKAHELDPRFLMEGPAEEGAVLDQSQLVGYRDLPVYASTEGGDGSLVFDYDPVDFVKRPAPLLHVKRGYSMIVSGNSMLPAYRPGDYALVNPKLGPKLDDVCLFFRIEGSEVRCTIKEYRGQSEGQWRVRRYHPEEYDFALDKADWPHCNVVVGKYSRR